jgi:hypothetical protein
METGSAANYIDRSVNASKKYFVPQLTLEISVKACRDSVFSEQTYRRNFSLPEFLSITSTEF